MHTVRRTWMAAAAALVVGLVLPADALAQAPPDLSGTWTLDEARSDPGAAAQAGRGGRGGPGGAGGAGIPPMIITQSATEISVQRGNQTFVYNVDGSESYGPPGGETKSRMAWEGGTLVVTSRREFFAGAEKGYQTMTGKDVYTLSGTTMTVERTITNAGGRGTTQTVRMVYTKS